MRPRVVPEEDLRVKKRFAYFSEDEDTRIREAMDVMGQTSFSEFLRLAALERVRAVAAHVLPGQTGASE